MPVPATAATMLLAKLTIIGLAIASVLLLPADAAGKKKKKKGGGGKQTYESKLRKLVKTDAQV